MIICFSQISYGWCEIANHTLGVVAYMSEENEMLLFKSEP